MSESMGVGRLEAFSDGVIAIIITIMVLELKVPHGADPWLLLGVWPVLLSYALSAPAELPWISPTLRSG